MEEIKGHINYDYFTNYSIDILPMFPFLVFLEKNINDDEKFKFVELVLNPYMTDLEFRNDCQENYVYFLKWKLFGIGITREDLDIPESYPGMNILRMLITDNQ